MVARGREGGERGVRARERGKAQGRGRKQGRGRLLCVGQRVPGVAGGEVRAKPRRWRKKAKQRGGVASSKAWQGVASKHIPDDVVVDPGAVTKTSSPVGQRIVQYQLRVYTYVFTSAAMPLLSTFRCTLDSLCVPGPFHFGPQLLSIHKLPWLTGAPTAL